MRLKSALGTALLAVAVASGCASPAGSKLGTKSTGSQPATGGKTAQPAAGATTDASALLAGRLTAPAGVIAAGGANVVAAGGGNVVAAGGGNVVAAGGGNLTSRQLLAVSENALANARVFLADAAGNPLPGFAAVTTDAKGQFKFPKVPTDQTFLVVAQVKTAAGKDAAFQTMTRPGKLGATADISAATTLVTSALVDGQTDLGQFNAAKFKSAIDATAKNLTAESLPDFSDRADVLATVKDLQASVAELKTALDDLRSQLKDLKASLDDLKQQLENQAGAIQASVPPGLPGEPAVNPATGAPPASGFAAVKLTMPTVAEAQRPELYPMTVAFSTKDGTVIQDAHFTAPTEVVAHRLPLNKVLDVTFQPAEGSQVTFVNFTFKGGADLRLPFPDEAQFIINTD